MPRFFFDIPQFLETIIDEDLLDHSVNEALKHVSLFEQSEIAHMIDALDMEYPELETKILKESRSRGKTRNPNAVIDQFGQYGPEQLSSICRQLFCALQICRVRICRLNKIATIKKQLEDTFIQTVHRLQECSAENKRLREELEGEDGDRYPSIPLTTKSLSLHSNTSSVDSHRGRNRNRYGASESNHSTPRSTSPGKGSKPRTPAKRPASARRAKTERGAHEAQHGRKSDALTNVRAAARAKIGVRGFMARIQKKKEHEKSVKSARSVSPQHSPRSGSPRRKKSPRRADGTRSNPRSRRNSVEKTPPPASPASTDENGEENVMDRIRNVLERADKIVELREAAETNRQNIAQRHHDIEELLETAPHQAKS